MACEQELNNQLSILQASINQTKKDVNSLKKGVDLLVTDLIASPGVILSPITEAIFDIGDILGATWGIVCEFFNNLEMPTASELWETLSQALQEALLAAILNMINQILAAILALINQILDLIHSLMQQIVDKIEQIKNEVENMVHLQELKELKASLLAKKEELKNAETSKSSIVKFLTSKINIAACRSGGLKIVPSLGM